MRYVVARWNRSEFWIFALALGSLAIGLGRGGLWPGVESGALSGGVRWSSEAAVRAPGVLFALVGALALGWGISRTMGARAGAWSGVAWATMPLVFENARIASGHALAQSAGAVALGLGLATVWGRGGRTQRGLSAGMFVPLGVWAAVRGGEVALAVGVVAAGCALAVLGRARDEGTWEKIAGISLGILAAILGARFALALPHAASAAPPGFDTLAEHLGHALFPWTPVALVGAARLAADSPGDDASEEARSARSRESSARMAALGTLVVAYAAQSWAIPRGVNIPFVAPAALALSAGVFARDLERSPRAWGLAACALVLGVAIVTRDLVLFPRTGIAALALREGATGVASLRGWVFAAAGAFTLGGIVACVRRRPAALAAGAVVAAALLMHGYVPSLSNSVSAGPAWRALAAVVQPGDEVGVLGANEQALGADFYARVPVRALATDAQAAAWLHASASTRRFLVADESHAAGLNHAYRALARRNVDRVAVGASGALLAVSDGRSLTLDHSMDSVVQSADESPLPASAAVFDDTVALEGTDVVSHGGVFAREFELAYRLRVLRAMPAGEHTFVHVDGPCPRINGDHEGAGTIPGGLYPVGYWLPGDRVMDRQRVSVPFYCPAGEYTVWFGFFRGDARMAVRGGEHDGENRVAAARLRVR